MRVRAVVEKKVSECNLWSIGLGPTWNTRSTYSTRVNWGCLGGDSNKQMSLYNATFRLYDSKCWNDKSDDTMEVVFSIRDAGPAQGALVTTSTSDCASLRLQVTDILSQSPWQDAYLWFGSYGVEDDTELKGKINDTIVGRFHSIQYTQFYTDFDGTMTSIWDQNQSTLTTPENGGKIEMAPDDVLIADSDLFQFTIPFTLKVGIENPVPSPSDEWSAGRFAHFISLGSENYVEEATENVVQIVWDGKKEVRLIYGADKIYVTGLNEELADGEEYCDWSKVG